MANQGHSARRAAAQRDDIEDFTQYLAAVKIGGLKLQVSAHLRFDQDAQAFKFTLRILGQPWLSAPIDPRVGAMKQSPFVALAASIGRAKRIK